MIVSAAIVTADGKTWSLERPARHSDILRVIAFETEKPVHGEEQGFLACSLCRHDVPGGGVDCPAGADEPHGLFLRRLPAENHAIACGQLTKPVRGGVLTSEDLW